ncbi:hypothetical protein [Phenylobacterium sp.]|uniref:hypothetical protein n=1 Tax=Phenylobacterium sp. TaxID=1871053 RepID=UPI002E37E4D3|nr:hypothetical protein [Phenylobacterium sp.]HEX4710273.1 hypothetical protein [Phenylobacterium sp.]
MRAALVAAQLAVIAIAAWKSGVEQMGAGSETDRKALTAAGLLILPVALFSLMPGFGPPEFADHAHNAFRYVALLVDAVAVLSGVMILQDVLGAAGERLYARLGFGLVLSATPLYLVWAALLLESHRAAAAGSGWAVGPWNSWLMSFSDILLFFGGLLTYAATALFALSLRRVQRIGAKASAAFLAMSLFAALCLIVRGIDFPDPAVVFAQGYTIPGWIAGIPAVPWFMPCIFGLILVRRAARALEVSASPASPSADLSQAL